MYDPSAIGSRCLLLVSFVAMLSGCAEGPVPYIVSMNPWRRQEWQADEQYQPTLHRQLAEIREVQEAAGGMTREQQSHWAREMNYLLESQDNPLMRAAAVDALAVLVCPAAEPGLRASLKDKDPTVRLAACRAWGRIGGKEAIGHLGEVLGGDTDLDVRIAAARELGRFSQPDAYQALGLALDDTDPALQYRAIQSLKQASGHDYGDKIEAWRAFAAGENAGPEYTPSIAQRLYRLF